MDKLKEISVNVSKKVGLPQWSSVMLSASAKIEVEGEDASKAFRQAWKVCWDEILEQEKTMSDKVNMTETKPEESFNVADNVLCAVHKCKMQHFEKDGEEWWSHKLENGKWCNGRDTKYNKELAGETI